MTNESIHETVDITRWLNEFALDKLRAQAREQVLGWAAASPDRYKDQAAIDRHIRLMSPRHNSMIDAPKRLAVLVQLRDKYATAKKASISSECDVFIFALGEAPDPRMTKIGGVPFWTSDTDWPVDQNGQPMMFIAQLCFGDSHDLDLPTLPGDVLSLFMPIDGHGDFEWWDPNQYRLIWNKMTLPDRSVNLAIPNHCKPLAPMYGVRYRTRDYSDLPMWATEPSDEWVEAERCAEIEGTKIGGLPFWQQNEWDMDGTYIGSIGSVNVMHVERWPFVNMETVTNHRAQDIRPLMIGDVGLINLFLNTDGSVSATVDCY